MAFEGEVVLGIRWIDVLYCYSPLDAAQGKAYRLRVCSGRFPIDEYAHTPMLQNDHITVFHIHCLCMPNKCLEQTSSDTLSSPGTSNLPKQMMHTAYFLSFSKIYTSPPYFRSFSFFGALLL